MLLQQSWHSILYMLHVRSCLCRHLVQAVSTQSMQDLTRRCQLQEHCICSWSKFCKIDHRLAISLCRLCSPNLAVMPCGTARMGSGSGLLSQFSYGIDTQAAFYGRIRSSITHPLYDNLGVRSSRLCAVA